MCVKPSERAAVIETDFVLAFYLMTVNWVLMVLCKKGCSEQFVRVLQSIYRDSDTFVSYIINNEVQERILNKRKNIKQGCHSSTQMYNYASDPLLLKLNKVLKGPKPVEEKLTVLGFVDDVKGIVTSIDEFHTLNRTLASFERAMGRLLRPHVQEEAL